MTDSQSVPEQQSWIPELEDFANFAKFPKKTELPEKFELTEKRGFELTGKKKKKRISAPQVNSH